jgi:hypothetical protein
LKSCRKDWQKNISSPLSDTGWKYLAFAGAAIAKRHRFEAVGDIQPARCPLIRSVTATVYVGIEE